MDDRYGGRGHDDRAAPWRDADVPDRSVGAARPLDAGHGGGTRTSDGRGRADDGRDRAGDGRDRAGDDRDRAGDGRGRADDGRDRTDDASATAGDGSDVEDDDLDRAFGHDAASVTRKTTGQRVRASTLVAVFVVVVAVAVGATLWIILGNIQTGIGGIFPAPGAALQRFEDRARDLDGVASTSEVATRKTAFASYEVTALVVAEPVRSGAERRAVVQAVSDLTGASGGNGVRVYALVRFGDLEVGVSPSVDHSVDRLRLAEEVARTAGTGPVRCDWERSGQNSAVEDDSAGSRVVVTTSVTGADLAALQQAVQGQAAAGLPGAEVVVRTPDAG